MQINKIYPLANIKQVVKVKNVTFGKKFECKNYLLAGQTTIKRRIAPFVNLNKNVDVYKVDSKNNESWEKYIICDENKNILGDMQIEKYRDHIYIANIEAYARHKYKGIGTKLVQIAVEKCIEHPQCSKIRLRARSLHKIQLSPVEFYKKLGFKELEQTQSDKDSFGAHMELHPTNYPKWIERLQKPILNPNANYTDKFCHNYRFQSQLN